MKVITLYKAPFAKNMLYCTEEHFLLKSVQKNLPAVLYYRIQNYHENKQKLGCLFLCVEAFSKNCTLLSGIWFTLLFSPFCKFLIVYIWILKTDVTLKVFVMSVHENSPAYQCQS